MTWKGTFTIVTSLAATDWFIGETDAGGTLTFQSTALVHKRNDGNFYCGGPLLLSTPLAIAQGGGGANTAAGIRANLGLGSMSLEATANYAPLAGAAFTGMVRSTLTSAAAETVPLIISNNADTAGTSAAIVFNTHSSSAVVTGKIAAVINGASDYHVVVYTYGPSALTERLRISQNGIIAGGSVKSSSYTVGTVPSAPAHGASARIYVSNESGGAVLAFSDATNWRRVTDRAVIS